MNIEIDRELCAGTGACARTYPEVFEVTDGGEETGKSSVRPGVDLAAADQARVQEAAESCPWGAITVTPGS